MADTAVHNPAQWQPLDSQPPTGRAWAPPLSRARTHTTQRSDAQQSQHAHHQPSIPSSSSFANYAPLYRASSSILTRQLTSRRSASPLRRIGSRRISTVAKIRRFLHRFSWNRRVKTYPYGKAFLQRQPSFVVTPDRSSYNYGFKGKDLARRKPKPHSWRSPQPVAVWKNSRPMDVLLNNGRVAELPTHLASSTGRPADPTSMRTKNPLDTRRVPGSRGRPLPSTFEPPPSTPVGATTAHLGPELDSGRERSLHSSSREQRQRHQNERTNKHQQSHQGPVHQPYASSGEPRGPALLRQPQPHQKRLQAWPKISLPVKHASPSPSSSVGKIIPNANESSSQSPNNTVGSDRSGRSGLDAITQTPLVDLGGPNESRFAADPDDDDDAGIYFTRVRAGTASSPSPLSRRAVSAIQPRSSLPNETSGILRERPLSMPAQPRSQSSRALARTVSTPPDSPTAVASSYRPESWRRSAIMVRGIRDSQVEDLIDLQDNSDFVGVWSTYIQRAIAQRAVDAREKKSWELKNETRWSRNLEWESDSDRASALTSTQDDASSESSSVAESSASSLHSTNGSNTGDSGDEGGGRRGRGRGGNGNGNSSSPHKTPPSSPPRRPNHETPGSIYSSDPPTTPTAITRDSHIRATTHEPGTPREHSTSKLAPLYSPRQMACASVTALALTGQTLASPPTLNRATLEEMPAKFSTLFSIRHSSWQPEGSVTSLSDLASTSSSANLNASVCVLTPDTARVQPDALTPEFSSLSKLPSASPPFPSSSVLSGAIGSPTAASPDAMDTAAASTNGAPADATRTASSAKAAKEHPTSLAPPSIISLGSHNALEVDFDFTDTASTSRKRPLPRSPLNTPPRSPATQAISYEDLPQTLASASSLALTNPAGKLLVTPRPVSSSISLEISPNGATEGAPALIRSQTHRQSQAKRVRSSVSREALIHTRQKTMESLWGGEDESDEVSS